MRDELLSAVLHHLLSGHGYGMAATVDEWLENWIITNADDARIAYGLRLALGLQPDPAPPGFTISVEWRGADPVVHFGHAGADLAQAKMPDLITAARRLLVADHSPSWPAIAPAKSRPVQMSLF